MLAKQVSDMEKGTSKLVDKYMDSGSPDALQCVLNWYGSWADAHALLAQSVDYTGKAVRKWALASLSGAWLRLQFSKSQQLAAPADERRSEGSRVGSEWVSKGRSRWVPDH